MRLDFLSEKRNVYLCLILLWGMTIFIYANSFENAVLNFDDNEYFTYPEIQQLSWANVKLYFSHYYLIMYQPLSVLSFAINYYFSQIETFPLHVFNLSFHLFNVLLVYLFVRKLSHKHLAAWLVATLFAIHPMNVEAVTWISARSSCLYTFFYLLALLFYLNYLHLMQKKYLIFTGLAFILSLFSKAQAVTLPFILLLIDYYYSRINRATLRVVLLEKTPFLILSCVFGFIAISDTDTVHNITNGMLVSYTYPEIICLVSHSFIFYLYKLFVPINLCAIHVYPPKINGLLPWIYYVAPFILTALVSGTWLIARNKKYVQFGLAFFLISIAINIQIIPSRLFIVSERYAYFPYLGLFFVIAQFYTTMTEKKIKLNYYLQTLLWGILLLYLFIFIVLSIQRNTIWKDNISFMSDIIQKNPEVPYLARAYGSRANALRSIHQLNAALMDYTKAIEIAPSMTVSYLNRASLYMKMNHYAEAIDDLNSAIKLQPNNPIMYSKRGLAKYSIQDNSGALSDVNRAIKLDPHLSEAYNLRAILRFSLSDYQGSKNDFDSAIRLNPRDSELYKNRGVMALKMQNSDLACIDFDQAWRMGNSSVAAMLEQYCHSPKA